MEIVDSHVHLEDLQNLDDALLKAEKAGVIAVITMGSDYDSNLWVLNQNLKKQRGALRIYSALGLHPWGLDTSKVDITLQLIAENIDNVVAIGEIGLDYWYKEVRKNPEMKEQQRGLFRRLLELAKNNATPVSVHSRGAWTDCVDIVIKTGIEKAVFHWFTGPSDILKKLLDYGYYISATPAVTYSKEHRSVVENTPLEYLLLETDSPVTYQGEPSEPAHVLKTLSAVAQLKNEKEETIAEKTTENARLVFRISS